MKIVSFILSTFLFLPIAYGEQQIILKPGTSVILEPNEKSRITCESTNPNLSECILKANLNDWMFVYIGDLHVGTFPKGRLNDAADAVLKLKLSGLCR